MFMYTDYNQHLLDNVKKIHFIGCGGSGMYPLIQILAAKGYQISGSDVLDGSIIRYEREMGVKVSLGHSADNVIGTDMVVYSAAISKDNVELNAAASYGIPTIERSVLLGYVSRLYKQSICVSGTHGKTTTTSMCTHILMAADRDPTVMIGGTLPLLNAGHRVGRSNTIIMEACEYYNSFLSFHPTVAVILNIEADHLDFFKDLADVQHSFREFALRTPEDGCVVANAEDANTMEALRGVPRRVITFGLTDKADVYAENIQFVGANSSFDIMYKGRKFTDVTLHVPGMHNVKNALAATAASICLGIRPNAVKYGLAGFNGAGRRFEFKGKYNGADVYDDYAHHPGELKALLDTVETLNYKRSIVVFQPHTYSRTAALFDDFVTQLKRPDVLFLAEIYAAREKNTIGISSADLAAKIDGARFFPTFDGLEAALRETLEPGDIVLTVGAGNVYKIGEDILADNEE